MSDSKTPSDSAARLKIGRNDPCHCGSGRKFKKCHGKDEEAVEGVGKQTLLGTAPVNGANGANGASSTNGMTAPNGTNGANGANGAAPSEPAKPEPPIDIPYSGAAFEGPTRKRPVTKQPPLVIPPDEPAPKAEAEPAPTREAEPAPKAEAAPAPTREAEVAPKAEAAPAPSAGVPVPRKREHTEPVSAPPPPALTKTRPGGPPPPPPKAVSAIAALDAVLASAKPAYQPRPVPAVEPPPPREPATPPAPVVEAKPTAVEAVVEMPVEPTPARDKPADTQAPAGAPARVAAAPSQPIEVVPQTATAKWYEAGDKLAAVSGPHALPAGTPTPRKGNTMFAAGVALAIAGTVVAIGSVRWASNKVKAAELEVARAREAARTPPQVVASVTPASPEPPPPPAVIDAAAPEAPAAPAASTPPPTTTAAKPAAPSVAPRPPVPGSPSGPITTPADAAVTPADATVTSGEGDCTFKVTSNARGGQVFVAGKPRGIIGVPVKTACGTTTIVVRVPGYEEATQTVNLEPGGTLVRVDLKRPGVEVIVHSTPPGATVTTSSGRTLGKTPLITKMPREEQVTLFLTLDGMEPQQRSITPKGDTTVNVTLSPAK